MISIELPEDPWMGVHASREVRRDGPRRDYYAIDLVTTFSERFIILEHDRFYRLSEDESSTLEAVSAFPHKVLRLGGGKPAEVVGDECGDHDPGFAPLPRLHIVGGA